MTDGDALILATVAGPILAVQAQKWIELARERRQKRLRVFYTLMATRAARVSADHVQALNMLDLEFYGRQILGFRWQSKKDRAVVEAWDVYRDHLGLPTNPETSPAWAARGDELFTDLLLSVSKALGFDFQEVQLKRGIYHPAAFNQNEAAMRQIQESLVKILSGKSSLNMAITSCPVDDGDLQRQRKVQAALLEHLSGDKAFKVQIAEEEIARVAAE